MSIILSELPSKNNGYWEIVNFPYALKGYQNQLLAKTEFIHKLYDKEKNKYVYGEAKYIEVALSLLMEIRIGDIFSCATKEIKIKEKRTERNFFFDGRLEHNLKIFDYERFKKFDNFLFSETANGSFYYEFEYFVNENDGKKRHIIIPSVVIAQAFFFKDSTFIELLYENNLRGVAGKYNKDSIKTEEDKKIGVFKYDNSNTNIKYSTGKAIGEFLYSYDDSLFYELEKTNNIQYLSTINDSSKIHFNYQIPIHKALNLTLEGTYYTSVDEVIFLANHISNFEGYKGHKLKIFTVDRIEIAPLIDKRSTDKRSEKEEIRINHTKHFRKPLRKFIKRNNNISDSKLGELDLKIKDAIFNLIKISKLKKEDQKYKYTSETSSVTNQTEETSHKKSDNLESGITKVNGSEYDKTNKETVFSYLTEVMKTIKQNHHQDIKIMILKDNFEGYEIYRICDINIENNVYFIEDFHDRIQIIHSEDLTKLKRMDFERIFILLKNKKYNWQKIKEDDKASDGIVFGTSINKYSRKETNSIKNGYQKIIKRINEIFCLSIEAAI
ncbi:hypothetical protein ACQWU4_09790 [Chryseobacterium sp. MIQD13]|uniref:hypothetical protein n=1 Tax=Chryseobacterium sp. MIQD13 TaxID=3422310 RepID=UPI003D2A329F